MENLPPELRRRIVSQLSPRSLRALSRSSIPKRREMPIGLASLGLRPPPVPIKRPPTVNRSVSRAKSVRIPSGGRQKAFNLNFVNPLAYKNTSWKYYSNPTRGIYYFYTAPKNTPYMINKKTGKHQTVNRHVNYMRRAFDIKDPLKMSRMYLKARKKTHTWSNYLKRAEDAKRYARGSSRRQNRETEIGQKVNRYLYGNSKALNNLSVSDIVWWAKKQNWTAPENFVRTNGQWAFYGGAPFTKNNLKEHLKLMHSMRN